ncbi:MAG: DUF4328 domain-containing protein [Arenimonas sp.]|nr:DUF4328 domain-containing protein [Rhizobium sp.]MBW8444060.1 DUF4328 domain-containing protein [Arenimonas sp.]
MTQGRIIPAKSLAGGLARARRAWNVTACAVGAMLTLTAGFYLYLAFVSYVVEKTGSAFRTGAENPLFQMVLDVSGIFDLCLAVLQFLTILFFLRWIWLSVTLARAIRRDSVRYTPWVAVLGFFVPIANLWMTTSTLRDIEKFSAGQEERVPPAFPWYPAGMVLCGVLVLGLWRIVSAAPLDGFADPAASQRLMQVAAFGAVAHLVLLMLTHGFMRLVSPGQELALRELAEAEGPVSKASAEEGAEAPRSGDDFPQAKA